MGATLAFEVGSLVVTTAGSFIERQNAADIQSAQLDEEGRTSRLQYLQKSNSRLNQLQNILSKQTAIETTRGVSLGSASFGAIQKKTFITGEKQQATLSLDERIKQQQIVQQKAQLQDSLFAQLFGSGARAVSEGAAIEGGQLKKAPKRRI